MVAIVSEHLAVFSRTVKPDSVSIGYQIVIPSVNYEGGPRERFYKFQIVKRVQDKDAGDKELVGK